MGQVGFHRDGEIRIRLEEHVVLESQKGERDDMAQGMMVQIDMIGRRILSSSRKRPLWRQNKKGSEVSEKPPCQELGIASSKLKSVTFHNIGRILFFL